MSGGRSATLLVRVIPRSGRTALAGKRGDAFLVRLAAAPVDGAANAALITLLADLLDCPRRHISIVTGEKGRDKQLRVEGLTDEDVTRRLTGLAP
jgi:uncharacterized protein